MAAAAHPPRDIRPIQPVCAASLRPGIDGEEFPRRAISPQCRRGPARRWRPGRRGRAVLAPATMIRPIRRDRSPTERRHIPAVAARSLRRWLEGRTGAVGRRLPAQSAAEPAAARHRRPEEMDARRRPPPAREAVADRAPSIRYAGHRPAAVPPMSMVCGTIGAQRRGRRWHCRPSTTGSGRAIPRDPDMDPSKAEATAET